MWSSPLRSDWTTEMGRMVPLPKLPEAQRRTRIGFCSVSENCLYPYKGRDNQIQFFAWNAARLLFPVWINVNLRKYAVAH